MKGDKMGSMKRTDDFWVTGPFSCYFVTKELLSCQTDTVTQNAFTFNTGVML